jgi:N-acetylglucosamine transport system substrate-binding protein
MVATKSIAVQALILTRTLTAGMLEASQILYVSVLPGYRGWLRPLRHAMQNRFERNAFVLLAAVLLVACSCGCDVVTVTQPGGKAETVVEAAVFEGGFGVDWHREIAAQYSELNRARNVRIKLWADPRVEEKIRPRILRGSPPDIADAFLPYWKLIVAGKAYPLDEFLDSPAYDTPGKTWRETFVPGVLQSFTYQGKTYGVPLILSGWMAWYDRRQFREHGWEVPRTWSEFTTLCDRIKAEGIAPLAFQGKYPEYAWWTFLTLIQRIGGVETFYRTQNLEPGALLLPDVVCAATMVQDIALKYFQRGSSAMTHTESQMEFVNGRAAMIFCGLWLENEMREATPPDFEMSCFNVPAVEDGRGHPGALHCGGGHYWMIYTDARHHQEAGRFLKYAFSVAHAGDFARRVDTLTAIRGSVDPDEVSPALLPAYYAIEQAPFLFAERLTLLYPQWNNDVMVNAIGQFVRGEITPRRFCELLEEGLEEIRRDPDIYKPPPITWEGS